MNTITRKFSDNLRIIWAITAKDIVDAVKNKAILTTILSVLFLMVFYKVMPSLNDGASPPRLAVYDVGGSSLMTRLESSTQFHLQEISSRQKLEYYLGLKSSKMLGLVLPPDFDRAVETDELLELDGYVDHWVDDVVIGEVQSFFEGQLTELTGKPVRINMHNDTVFTHVEGWHPFTASLMFTVVLAALGFMVVPGLMLEEKKAKTLEALLVSPAGVWQVVIGKAMAGLFYCLLGAGVVLAFNAAMVVHWGVIVLAVICGALFTIALGLLLGMIFKVRQQLSLWGFILFQPLVIPVGLPPELLPDNVEAILSAIPTFALAKVFRVAFTASAPLAEFGPQLAYTAGCAVLILAAVAWRVRRSDQ